ncbi:MBL fold metallo-hydrolase [Trichloromonas sp.]|uniref:MBL fold metallo-hydrolase n=1 Tax=Trichloromonas sp. TaxID=3069249 RepID=UPI002A3E7EDE|nr:MBL fold metallo-hydrolase [Trichloromonas sp.]
MTQSIIAADAAGAAEAKIRFHVVFNNLPYKAGLRTSWGFACLIEGLDKTVLFDTGGNGDILLANMQRLGLDAEAVDAVVLSHIHDDHVGGLDTFLAHNPDVTVYLPESFPVSFQREVMRLGAAVETVSGPRRLLDNIYSTGEMQMSHGIEEQALIVDSPRGLVVITGCAHPNVADMAEQARTYLGKNIYLLMGGFHLGGSSDAEIHAIIKRLKALGVRKVAPSHCTGDNAIELFRKAWQDDFMEGGLGAVIEVTR